MVHGQYKIKKLGRFMFFPAFLILDFVNNLVGRLFEELLILVQVHERQIILMN